MRIAREHDFGVPLETGFDYIVNIANWPEYWPGIVRVDPASRWAAAGDEARIVVRLLGREVELRMTLGRFEQNRLVEYDSRQEGLPDARHERHFEPIDGGFRYGLVVEYEPRAALRGLYDRILVRRGVERALERTVANLEASLPR